MQLNVLRTTRFFVQLSVLILGCWLPTCPVSAEPLPPACAAYGNAAATTSLGTVGIDYYVTNTYQVSDCGLTVTAIWLYAGDSDTFNIANVQVGLYRGTTMVASTGTVLQPSTPAQWVSLGITPTPLDCGQQYTVILNMVAGF